MSAPTPEQHLGELLSPEIAELLDQRQNVQVRTALLDLLDPEVADVLMALEPRHRVLAFRLLPRDRAAEVFTFLPAHQQDQLLSELSSEQMASIFDAMAPDDRAELLEEMPGQLAARLLALMRPEERRQTQIILGYPTESVGRIMTPDYLTLSPEWSVQQALEHLRKHGRDAETLDVLYITDEKGKLLDAVSLRQLLLADPAAPIRALLTQQVVALQASDDREQAVRTMEHYDRPVLPVVDSHGVLVGIVTFDDVADVAEEETTEDIQKQAAVEPLQEPYVSVPLWELVRKRGTWLAILFLGETFTASAMGFFEEEITQVVVLTLFIPLIISSGGNSGSQASTLIIRAMALGEITLKDWWRVARRELACGLLLGLILGLIGVGRVVLWHALGWGEYTAYYPLIGLTVGFALLNVVLWGTVVGSMLPFALRRVGLDPAATSAPLVATIVDITGLVIYFSTALLLLKGSLL